LPGGIFTHWKAPPYHGAHPLQTWPWSAGAEVKGTLRLM
jgi:hypothetical protein